MSDAIELRQGDILLFGTYGAAEGGVVGRIIKKREAEKPADVFAIHSEVVSVGGMLLPDNAGEIKTAGTTSPHAFADKDLAAHTGDTMRVWRLRNMRPMEAAGIVGEIRALAEKNWPYAYMVLAAMYGDYWVNRAVKFLTFGKVWPKWEPFASMVDGDVCSTLIARLFDKYVGISFGDRPRKVSPHDIDTYCKLHPLLFDRDMSTHVIGEDARPLWEGTVA